jgi:dipeptidyl aminopeptidase/acylaminoacyl peptidase
MLRVLTGAFCALSAGAAAAAPLEAYGKLPNIDRVEISPGGAFIAVIVTDGDQRTLAIQTADDHKLKFVSRAGATKVRDLTWAGDDHLIVTTSTTKQPAFVDGPRVEHYISLDINLKTGKMRGLLENVRLAKSRGITDAAQSPETLNTVLSIPAVRTVNGKPVAFVRGWNFIGGEGQVALFRVTLDDDAAMIVDEGGGGAYDWLVSPQGELLAKASYKDRLSAWKLAVKPAHQGWRTVETVGAPIDTPDFEGLGRDGTSALIALPDEKEGTIWRELSTETGAWGETLTLENSQSVVHDPASGRLIGTYALVGDTPSYSFFDAHDAVVWRAVEQAFPGDLVELRSWTEDRKKIVVRVDSATLGPAYAIVNLNTSHADWLGAEYEGLEKADISPRSAVRYKAADGLEITGYLTLPRGRDPHDLPLVVLPHGGPEARDEPGFDWWPQALASRGYAVLQPNFRGSAGFGKAFVTRGYGEFGRKMETDLSDGVRNLVKQGVRRSEEGLHRRRQLRRLRRAGRRSLGPRRLSLRRLLRGNFRPSQPACRRGIQGGRIRFSLLASVRRREELQRSPARPGLARCARGRD